MFKNAYANKTVFVTGHTGFKGSWLTAWLLKLGAKVVGYAKDIPSKPANFEVLHLENQIVHIIGDVRDKGHLSDSLKAHKPDLIFHLAAQPLVKKSFADPIATFEANALGTLNLLENIRENPLLNRAVIITSDKCYRNVEWLYGYREDDELGGDDPYSASKAAAEIFVRSYQASYFLANSKYVACARAGNVIGGGDWALDRIVPDCMRAFSSNEPLTLRMPNATRPWQHVLEPLSGYLWLGLHLFENQAHGTAYNFGPTFALDKTVLELISALATHWPAAQIECLPNALNQESSLLRLCCDKAASTLKWHASMSYEETIAYTASWYRRFYEGRSMLEFTLDQITSYEELAKKKGLAWALAS